MANYITTNNAGGVELRTTSKARALSKLNKLQFPGDVKRWEKDHWVVIETELDRDGYWVEVENAQK